MRIEDHLTALAKLWCAANSRSITTLGIHIGNDGKLFGRVARGGCSLDTFSTILSFFRSGANWPDGCIPEAAVSILDNFENIATDAGASIGKVAEVSSGSAAASAPPETQFAGTPQGGVSGWRP